MPHPLFDDILSDLEDGRTIQRKHDEKRAVKRAKPRKPNHFVLFIGRMIQIFAPQVRFAREVLGEIVRDIRALRK